MPEMSKDKVRNFLLKGTFTGKLGTINKKLIEYIAKHEIGHILGLGHANFNESLMSALVYRSYNEISDCERKAIAEANKWKLIDNNSIPIKSQNKNYFC